MNTDNTREAAIDHELRDSAVNRCLDYLFANGSGQKAERLVLTSKDGRDLGGWARAAMRDVIAKVFNAGAAAQPADSSEGNLVTMNCEGCGKPQTFEEMSPPWGKTTKVWCPACPPDSSDAKPAAQVPECPKCGSDVCDCVFDKPADDLIADATEFIEQSGYCYRPTFGEPLLSQFMASFARQREGKLIDEFVERVKVNAQNRHLVLTATPYVLDYEAAMRSVAEEIKRK